MSPAGETPNRRDGVAAAVRAFLAGVAAEISAAPAVSHPFDVLDLAARAAERRDPAAHRAPVATGS
jgi:hypothetical protein